MNRLKKRAIPFFMALLMIPALMPTSVLAAENIGGKEAAQTTAGGVNVLEKDADGKCPCLLKNGGSESDYQIRFYNGKDGNGKPIPFDPAKAKLDLDQYFGFECSFSLAGGNNKDDKNSYRPQTGDYAEIDLSEVGSGIQFPANIPDQDIYAAGANDFKIGTLHVEATTARLTFDPNVWNNQKYAISAGFGAELDTETIKKIITSTQNTFTLLGQTIRVNTSVQKTAVDKLEKADGKPVDGHPDEIAWAINAAPADDGSLAGVTISDPLQASGSVKQKYVQDSLNVAADGRKLTSGTDYTLNYALDDKTNRLDVVFDKETSAVTTGSAVTIAFNTQIVGYDSLNGADLKFKNTATATRENAKQVFSNEASYTVSKPKILTKECSAFSDNIADWKIKVNAAGVSYPKAYVQDTLPAGLTLLEDPTYTINNQKKTFTEADPASHTPYSYVYDAKTRVINFYLGDPENNNVVIDYATRFDPANVTVNDRLDNLAMLYWYAEGTGVVHTGQVGVPLPVNTAGISKWYVANSIDYAKGTLQWKVNVQAFGPKDTTGKPSVDDAKVTEIFLYRADGSVDSKKCASIGKDLLNAFGSDKDAVLNSLCCTGNGDIPFSRDMDYQSVSDGIKVNDVKKIDFTSGGVGYTAHVVTFDLSTVTGNKTFTVTAGIPAKKALLNAGGNNGAAPFTNRAELNYGSYGKATASSTAQICCRIIDKQTGNNGKLTENGEIDWHFVLNEHKCDLENATVTDTLPAGLTATKLIYRYADNTCAAYDFASKTWTGKDPGWTISYDNKKNPFDKTQGDTVTAEIPVGKDRVDFDFFTKVSADVNDNINTKIHNIGYISGDNLTVSSDWEDVWLQNSDILSKTGEVNAGKIKWTIRVNPNSLTLKATSLTLTDMMGPNQTVSQVTADGVPYGKATGAAGETNVYAVNGTDLIFSGLSADKAHTVVITTNVINNAGVVENQAKLEGLKKTITTEEIKTKTAASSGSGAVSEGGVLKVFKHDARDPESSLVGAEFKLYNLSDEEITALTYDRDNQCYTASGLGESGYILKETSAPYHYELSTRDAKQSVTQNGANTTGTVSYDSALKGYKISFSAANGANVDVYDDVQSGDLTVSKDLTFTNNGTPELTGTQMTFAFQVTAAESALFRDGGYSLSDGKTVQFSNRAAILYVTSGTPVTIRKLPIGKYTVEETGVVDSNGKIVPVDLSGYTRTTSWAWSVGSGDAGKGTGLTTAASAPTVTENGTTYVAFQNAYARTYTPGGTPVTPQPPATVIPEPETPLAPTPGTPKAPDTPDTDIPDDKTPAADIPDDKAPLAQAPKTGDTLPAWLAAAGLSGLLLAIVSLLSKKRKDGSRS